MVQPFPGEATDPSPSWVLDFLVRTLPPWRGVYPSASHRPLGKRRHRESGGDRGDAEGSDSDGSGGPAAHTRRAKRQRGAPPALGSDGGGLASHRREHRPGTLRPRQRVMALPSGCFDSGHGSCPGRSAGMPSPRELDYDTELTAGFCLGVSHYRSPVWATGCELFDFFGIYWDLWGYFLVPFFGSA